MKRKEKKTSMKNKFKKSKIIVLALALITATTVASVTGTVAWFTANRAVTVTLNAFASTKLESNLEVTLTSGNGTSVNSSNSKQIDIDGKLTHGSYDAKNYSISDSNDTYCCSQRF